MPAAPLAADVLLVLLRWLHALAAAALLGSALVLLLWPGATADAARPFKDITDTTLLVFLATGAILSFDRLSQGASGTYAVLLAVKVALSLGAYQLAFRWRRAGLATAAREGRLLLLLGAGAVLLAAVLKEEFERGLRHSLAG